MRRRIQKIAVTTVNQKRKIKTKSNHPSNNKPYIIGIVRSVSLKMIPQKK